MTFSIIIVSYNTAELLRACLTSIGSSGSGFVREIIVVDNASHDQSAALVEQSFPAVRLIKNTVNCGFASACNAGAAVATGESLLFLNSDAELSGSFLSDLAEIFARRQDITVAGPSLRDAVGRTEGQSYGRFPTIMRSILHQVAPASQPRDGQPLPVDWVSGAALAIRRSAFALLGGFDENYFMYFEDVDLCYRAQRRGMGVFFLPALMLLHRRGASLQDDGRRRKYYRASQRYYFAKHYGRLASGLIGFLRLFR